jgi:Flp pilus assembly protein CpaB
MSPLAANLEAGQVIKAENLHLVDWPATVPLPARSPTRSL